MGILQEGSVGRQAIARYYDDRIIDSKNINLQIVGDGIFHNHNGLIFSDEEIADFDSNQIKDILHEKEHTLARLGIQTLAPSKSSIIYDAGCGAGGSAILMHGSVECQVVGTTLSEQQARLALSTSKHKNMYPAANFLTGDMLLGPFPSQTFDAIYASESTEHVINLSQMFQEFSRVVKPNGHLVIIAWCMNPDYPQGENIIQRINAAYLTSLHPKEEYLQVAQNNGWERKELIDITEPTARYWRFRRDYSPVKSGTEEFMAEGFSSRAVKYFIFKFQH